MQWLSKESQQPVYIIIAARRPWPVGNSERKSLHCCRCSECFYLTQINTKHHWNTMENTWWNAKSNTLLYFKKPSHHTIFPVQYLYNILNYLFNHIGYLKFVSFKDDIPRNAHSELPAYCEPVKSECSCFICVFIWPYSHSNRLPADLPRSANQNIYYGAALICWLNRGSPYGSIVGIFHKQPRWLPAVCATRCVTLIGCRFIQLRPEPFCLLRLFTLTWFRERKCEEAMKRWWGLHGKQEGRTEVGGIMMRLLTPISIP